MRSSLFRGLAAWLAAAAIFIFGFRAGSREAGGRPEIPGGDGGVRPGIEVLLEEKPSLLAGRRVGVISNLTGIDRRFRPSWRLVADLPGVRLTALFGPEHGFLGGVQGRVDDDTAAETPVPIFSLHGETRRPTPEMLENVEVLVFDIQDIGSRSYTYISTLHYALEEAAAHGVAFVVLDRPNPLGGLLVDGPVLDPEFASFIGTAPIPYLHGMTVGELAIFLNRELEIGADLTVVPMRGWRRDMHWPETGLPWVPTSPHIPEPDSPWYYPVTGILGEASLVSVGVGYPLPFKVIGAPWMDAAGTAEALNALELPGIFFQPFHYRPYYAKYAGEFCRGVRLVITDHRVFRPVSAGYHLMAVLRRLYPGEFSFEKESARRRRSMFDQANGTDLVRRWLEAGVDGYRIEEKISPDRDAFLGKRSLYLLYD